METGILSNIKEIGIALFAVVAFAYITRETMNANKDVFNSLMSNMKEQENNYKTYVETNNHQKTELLTESTKALTNVGNAIQQHTKILEKLVDKLDK